jgi:hypothetical protein
MPEYSVSILFDGQGRIKVRANSEREALEDAQQMDPEDVDWAIYNIRATNVRQIPEATNEEQPR